MSEIRDMVAGRELDELIQVKFFEVKYMCHIDGCLENHCCIEGNIYDCTIAEDLNKLGLKKEDCSAWKMVEPEPYSTDIAAAWEIVNKMRMPFEIQKSYEEKYEKGEIGFFINWCNKEHDGESCYLVCPEGRSIWAETAPEAICKAALLAVEEK